MDRGCVQVYCGNGKGKTTAAVGLCVRAAGQGLRVLFLQFMKDGTSGELRGLAHLPGVTVLDGPLVAGFPGLEDQAPSDGLAERHRLRFREAVRRVSGGEFDLLVLDEANGAMHQGLLPAEEVAAFLDARPKGLEVVLTGRHPPAAILDRADYVSEIRCRKHPYREGQAARRGIEW